MPTRPTSTSPCAPPARSGRREPVQGGDPPAPERPRPRVFGRPDLSGGPRHAVQGAPARRGRAGRSWSLTCLATNQVLAGTVLGFTLGVARKLVQRTEDNSKKMLLNVFGKQPRFVWLEVDGVEVETPLERLKVNDIIVVHTGETVPVDGEVVDGMAMVDQHTLTGESAPVEKIKGDQVLASTTLIAGKVRVAVTSAGRRHDLGQARAHPQRHGRLQAALAVEGRGARGSRRRSDARARRARSRDGRRQRRDRGRQLRPRHRHSHGGADRHAELADLSAEHGILVKDGRALELLRSVDTVLFDKTGTLTRERPEVGRVLTYGEFTERSDPAVGRGGREQVQPSDRQGDPRQVQGTRADAAEDRRLQVPRRLRDHGRRRRSHGARRQRALHEARGHRAARRSSRGAGRRA